MQAEIFHERLKLLDLMWSISLNYSFNEIHALADKFQWISIESTLLLLSFADGSSPSSLEDTLSLHAH